MAKTIPNVYDAFGLDELLNETLKLCEFHKKEKFLKISKKYHKKIDKIFKDINKILKNEITKNRVLNNHIFNQFL